MSPDVVSRIFCSRRGIPSRGLSLALLLSAGVLTACGSPAPATVAPHADAETVARTPTTAVAQSQADEPSPGAGTPSRTAPVADGDSDFGRMLVGFHQCRYEGLFVNDLPGQPTTAPDIGWFRAHPAAACGRDDDFHYFCMSERYQGLDVRRMALPRTGGLPSVALYLKQDLATARSILQQQLGSDFRSSPASEAGIAPELVADPADASGSILVCTREF
ncbi:hypothetical protein ERT44_16345 [Stenotrophomonas sp. MA5]|jgi:hypothetical protein|uniref:hypothetical protein n=1 Tax=Stenotrophomonas sp. MA5 TaxID=2508572 RepID=UPI0010099DE1|nr:hypothetical protein [Stenotrophomonas sp. MA5]RXK64252.1 hypothetical protein ERT44_16345 [Stenotrophomonas sp. MA5]